MSAVAARDVRVSLLAPAIGMFGALAIAAGSVAAAVTYRGIAGEAYSPLNHFVSELGELGVSSLASIFNAGIVLGGLGFVVFIVGLARARGGWSALVVALVGIVAGLAGALVGVFPMNERGTHVLVALTFFLAAPISVGIASLGIVRRPEPRFPRGIGALGLVTALLYVAFIVDIFSPAAQQASALAAPSDRPGVWDVPALEWAAIASLVAWVLATGIAWLRDGSEGARA